MPFFLFFLFAAVPFIELGLLIYLGRQIGFWATIAIVLGTAFIGAVVLNRQGLQTMQRISRAMASGEPPIEPVVDGFFIAIAGVFLLTPGVLTDLAGIALLVPPVRRAIARWGFARIVSRGAFTVRTYRSGSTGTADSTDDFTAGPSARPARRPNVKRPRRKSDPGPVIDGEFEEIDKKS